MGLSSPLLARHTKGTEWPRLTRGTQMSNEPHAQAHTKLNKHTHTHTRPHLSSALPGAFEVAY